jgi:hypothetical protein
VPAAADDVFDLFLEALAGMSDCAMSKPENERSAMPFALSKTSSVF